MRSRRVGYGGDIELTYGATKTNKRQTAGRRKLKAVGLPRVFLSSTASAKTAPASLRGTCRERHRAPRASCSSPRGPITSCLMTVAAAPAALFASVPAQPTAEESAAAAWLGRSVHGYCAETSDQGDCRTGLKGTWSLTPHEVRHGWLGAAVACLARCRRCQRCHTVSLAVRFTDCSWFAADAGCHTSELEQKPSGFRSAPLSAATPSRNSSTPASFRGVGQRSAELRSDEFDVLDRLQYGATGDGLGAREGRSRRLALALMPTLIRCETPVCADAHAAAPAATSDRAAVVAGSDESRRRPPAAAAVHVGWRALAGSARALRARPGQPGA